MRNSAVSRLRNYFMLVLVILSKDCNASGKCNTSQALPRQVGGEKGPTSMREWDFYTSEENKIWLLSIYNSESEDIIENSAISSEGEKFDIVSDSKFTVLQLCAWSIDSPPENSDDVCQEIMLPTAKVKIAKLYSKGEKILAITHDL